MTPRTKEVTVGLRGVVAPRRTLILVSSDLLTPSPSPVPYRTSMVAAVPLSYAVPNRMGIGIMQHEQSLLVGT
jgi:hypothetical protein